MSFCKIIGVLILSLTLSTFGQAEEKKGPAELGRLIRAGDVEALEGYVKQNSVDLTAEVKPLSTLRLAVESQNYEMLYFMVGVWKKKFGAKEVTTKLEEILAAAHKDYRDTATKMVEIHLRMKAETDKTAKKKLQEEDDLLDKASNLARDKYFFLAAFMEQNQKPMGPNSHR